MQYIRRSLPLIVTTCIRNSRKVSVSVALQAYRKYKSNYNTGALLLSLGWIFNTKNVSETSNKDLIATSDELYKENKYREIYNLLKDHIDCNDVEILWRLARVQYNLSQEFATSPEEKKSLIFNAFNIIEKSLALDDQHFANHKWMSILLDAKSGYEGIKSRIAHLETVKAHMIQASKLNPKDATTLYMCYQIADMPWYQRKIAATIFAAPPHSSYEEGLEYFVRAEEVEPRFYSHNLLMLGKTFLKLNKEDKARYYLDLACNYPVITDDDRLANKEACELLQKLKK